MAIIKKTDIVLVPFKELAVGALTSDIFVNEGFQIFSVQALINSPSQNSLAASANPADADTVTIGGKVYTFKAALSAAFTEGQVLIGTTALATLAHLVEAIN